MLNLCTSFIVQRSLNYFFENLKFQNVQSFSLRESSSIKKQYKTIMLTPQQIERGKQLKDLTGMSFSELVGYLIENAE